MTNYNVKYLILILLFQISSKAIFSQDLNLSLSFRNLSINDGLSSNTVMAIKQDSKGRMWIATTDGLNLFDGSQFVVYKYSSNDSNSIIGNQVSTITVAEDGRLWIGCGNGLCIYNPETDVFNNINSLLNSPDEIKGSITSIVFENKDVVWVGSSKGLYRLNYKTKVLKHYDDSQVNYNITQIYIDKKKKLWIGTQSGGVVFYDRFQNKFIKFKGEKFNNGVSSVNTARTILEDSRGNIWVGSDLGLEQYDIKTRTYRTYYYDPNNPKGPLQNMVRSIFEDNQKRLWIGFNNGLTIFDRDKNEFIKIKKQVGNPRSISAEEVWCMFQDNKGSVWFGFYTSGVSIYDYDQAKFQAFSNNPDNPNSLAGNYVNNFCEDKLGNIWVATGHKGFDYYNFKTNTFTHHRNDPKNKNSLSSNAVLSIDYDHEGKLWIGTWGGGLNCFDPKTNSYTNFVPKPNDTTSINGIHIWRAVEDKSHNLLIATQQEGLGYYLRDKKIFKTFKNNPSNPKSLAANAVNCIYRDKQDVFWIGTSAGLSKLEDNQFNFKNYLADSIYIFDVINDNRGTLWVASDAGLIALNLKNGTVKEYTSDDGLGSDIVNGILEDSHHNLWLSTFNGGLTILNTDTRKIQNLTINDGLVSLSFKKRARLKLTDGRMLFGTTEGFILFNPDSVKVNFPAPKIILSDFKIYNKSIKNRDKNAPLKKHITFADTIILDHNQSVFSIYYTALNFIAPEKNNYAYLLEGFDKNWNYVGHKRDANYTNLDPGKYIFRVKVSVNRDMWSDNEASVTIIILPPFYKTWWFRSIFALFILSILLSIYYIRLASVHRANIQLAKLVEERTREIEQKSLILSKQTNELNKSNTILEERQQYIEKQAEELKLANNQLTLLNATKDRFFSIIAHDLRNPFNNILGFTEILNSNDRKLSEEEQKIISKQLYLSANSTYNLLENLLEWSRTQSNRIAFQTQNVDLESICQEVIDSLSSNFKHIVIKYLPIEKITFNADSNMIKTILRNLISNAIKFSHKYSKVNVYAEKNDINVIVTVSDFGTGIEKQNLNKLFDFTQKFSSEGTAYEKGTGLGLIICKEFVEKHGGQIWVESVVGKGSDFKFTIPI
jgi:ligand-binding sensor domain-containing protein/signal transduction histidine kinase